MRPGGNTNTKQLKNKMSTNWIRVIDEELLEACLGTASSLDSYETAREKLLNLISHHVGTATNPATNGGYSLRKVTSEALQDLDFF